MSTSGTTDGQTPENTDTEEFRSYVRSELASYEARIEELEDAVEERDKQIEELQEQLEELDERTDMLQLVEDTDQMEGEQRSVALLQHLHREARQCKGADRTAVNKERAKEILHYPDIDRTTYYSDFQRCERLVGDEEVCWYESDGVESRLVLDLEGVDDPTNVSTEFAKE